MSRVGTPGLIALDIGNVCISLHVEKACRKLGVLNFLPPPAYFMEKCTLLECGLISEDEWFDEFAKVTKGKFTRDELRDAWYVIIGPSLPGMKEAVTAVLKKGYTFAYLSDTSAIHMNYFFRTNDFCHLASGAVFSYEVGATKPHDSMYEEFERRYGRPCIYFDDKQKNIDGALKRGWNAVLFRTVDDFTNSFE